MTDEIMSDTRHDFMAQANGQMLQSILDLYTKAAR